MPVPSSELPGSSQRDSSVFAGSGDAATEMGLVSDGIAANLNELHAIDPDQVAGTRAAKRLGPIFWIALSWFGLIVVLAVLASVLPLKSHTAPIGPPRRAPSANWWFGTDAIGRDVFSRVIWGARVSLVVGFASIVFGLIVGGTIGVVSGYLRGRVEALLMGFCDVLLSFPALLLAVAIVSFNDSRSVVTISLAIGVVSIAPVARLVRANTLVFAQREFVTASRSLGASNLRIIRKEILPNVVPPVMSFSIILVAIAIVAESGLAFLGLSVNPPNPTWGGMISEGTRFVIDGSAPWISLLPCLVLFLTVLALNLAGDRLRQYLDIKDGES